MKKSFLLTAIFIFLIPFFNIQASNSAISANPIVRIGIIQHFGKSSNDVISIKAVNEQERLQLVFPSSPNSQDLKDLQTQELNHFEIRTKLFPLEEPFPEQKKIIAGVYRTYETASYWSQSLKDKFPELNWQVVYPGPWQVWAQCDNPQEQMEKLQKANFKSAWIHEKSHSKKVLSWKVYISNSAQNEEFEFNRSKLIIKSLQGKPLKVNNKIYMGTIEIIPDSFGTYTIVNELPIEEYLRGVVPFEIGADAPKAALETQAILARTYTLANLNRFLPENYNLCATQDCQVYGGLGVVNKSIDDAIKTTSGIIVKDKDGSTAQIFYYSTDGGSSANFQDIWPAEGSQKVKYLVGTMTCSNLPSKFDLSKEDDARIFLTSTESKNWSCYDSVSPSFRWEKKLSIAELNQLVGKARSRWKFSWPEFKQVKDLKINKRSNTGRVTELAIVTDKGEFTVDRDEVRAAVGGLKSSFFVMDKEMDLNGNLLSITFRGGGYGHGVGLSQYGARNLAALGMTSDRILKLYFPNYEVAHL
jgi:SpoIID/LytB domain protein